MIGMSVGPVRGWFGDDDRDLEASDVELDEALTLLRNERRRMIVRYVAEMPESEHEAASVRVRDLSETLAARKRGCTPDEVPANVAKSMYVSLIDTHLPQLDAAGVLDYDESRKSVRHRLTVDVFAAVLEEAAERFDCSEEVMA